VAASLERSDHLALMGDVLLPALEKAFGLSKKLFQGGAVHPLQPSSQINARAVFLPVESIWSLSRPKRTPDRPKRSSESDFDSDGP
jgi:hypothetical protein